MLNILQRSYLKRKKKTFKSTSKIMISENFQCGSELRQSLNNNLPSLNFFCHQYPNTIFSGSSPALKSFPSSQFLSLILIFLSCPKWDHFLGSVVLYHHVHSFLSNLHPIKPSQYNTRKFQIYIANLSSLLNSVILPGSHWTASWTLLPI